MKVEIGKPFKEKLNRTKRPKFILYSGLFRPEVSTSEYK